MTDKKLLQLKHELSKSVVSFEKGNEGGYRIFYNNYSGYQEFKDNLNHLYYEFIKEVQENLSELNSEKESQIYLEMLLHLFELLNEQIGTFPEFVSPHRNTKFISRINTQVACIHTNPDELNQLLIYFQHQKKVICKSIRYIKVFQEKCSGENQNQFHAEQNWQNELIDFYPEITRIKGELISIPSIKERISYLQEERKRLAQFYRKDKIDLYNSPINYFFESRIECLKEVYLLLNESSYSENGKSLQTVSSNGDLNQKSFPGKLSWTANKADLVELIYGLYHSRSLNNGKASIQEISSILEGVFDIDLNDVYRTYSEIRSRKLGQIKFLDHMRNALQNKIDELDEKM